jgi:hypothetical protein
MPPAYYAQLVGRDGGLTNFVLRLALNCEPTDLCFLSSWDYKCFPPHPAQTFKQTVLVVLLVLMNYPSGKISNRYLEIDSGVM